MKVWVLTDKRPGNSKQAQALAEILGYKYKIKKMEYNFLSKLPNLLRFGFIGISSKSKKILAHDKEPQIIISSGRRSATVALHLKKKYNCKVVQIMNPDLSYHHFDLTILPKHDKKHHKKYPANVIFVNGAVSYLSPEHVDQEIEKWKERLSSLPKPYTMILIGGPSKHTKLTRVNIRHLLEHAFKLHKKFGGSLVVSASRRTTKQGKELVIKMLKERPDIKTFYFDPTTTDGESPYVAFLGLAERFYITGDSVSMCSEAIETHKPVYIFVEPNMLGKKHSTFINSLFADKLAIPLDENASDFKPHTLKTSEHLRKKIHKILGI